MKNTRLISSHFVTPKPYFGLVCDNFDDSLDVITSLAKENGIHFDLLEGDNEYPVRYKGVFDDDDDLYEVIIYGFGGKDFKKIVLDHFDPGSCALESEIDIHIY